MPRIQLPPSGIQDARQSKIDSASSLSRSIKRTQEIGDVAMVGQSMARASHTQECSRRIVLKRQRMNSMEGGNNSMESCTDFDSLGIIESTTAAIGSNKLQRTNFPRPGGTKLQRRAIDIYQIPPFLNPASRSSSTPVTTCSIPSLDYSSSKRKRFNDYKSQSPPQSIPNIDRESRQIRRTRSPIQAVLATPLTPPISNATLRELDLYEILDQEQLRHDLVLNNSLLFRPNNDGER